MKTTSIFRSVTVCLVLAAGFGIAWGLGIGLLGGIVSSFFAVPQITESLILTHDGQPLIQSYTGGNYFNQEVRTLDGKVLEPTEDLNQLWPVEMHKPYQAPGVVPRHFSWQDRLAMTSDSQKPPVIWSLIRNAEIPGKVYLAGHDITTAHNVGYLGRTGLRSVVPPVHEWFDVGGMTFDFESNVVALGGYLSRAWQSTEYNYSNAGRGSFQPWTVFIRDGNTIHELDLRKRSTREIGSFDNLVGVEIILLFVPVQFNEEDNPHNLRNRESRLLVRTSDRLVLYNVFDSTRTAFPIPEKLKQKSFGVSTIGAERLMLHIDRGYWEKGNVVGLMTLTPNGEIEEDQNVRLVNYVPENLRSTALSGMGLAPTLLPLAAGMLILAPLEDLQNHKVESFQQSFSKYLEAAWPALILLAIMSTVLTAIVHRWQKKYSRPHTLAWTVFVFLTTLPGFFAYCAMHRREPLTACPHCKDEVPRNREACASCSEVFPEPKLLGTEVFA